MTCSRVFLIVFQIVFCISLQAQEFGGHPPSTRWNHLADDSIDLIYPPASAEKARSIFTTIHRIPAMYRIPNNPRPLPLVLQQQTIFSNGYVGMGPYRSEFQLTPLQNSFRLGSLPWHTLLALHEYRHVQQYDYFNRGLARVMYKTLGQEAGALLNSVAIPNWFWEGDAVFQETVLSTQGRGRIPYFFNDARAIFQSNKRYPYMKWRNGSYRDQLPDHYTLGYLLRGYGEQHYGNEFWNKVTASASAFQPIFYPFQGAVKRQSGNSFKTFYKNSFRFYQDKEPVLKDSMAKWAASQKHFVHDIEFPQWINDHQLIYAKATYKRVTGFYIRNLKTGTEKRMATRRLGIDNQFSYNNGRMVYASYQADPRWTWRDYSVIIVHDLQSGTERQITHRSRLFSPDIDSSGTRIAAVAIDSASNSRLLILSAETGTLIQQAPNPHNYFFTYPKFRDATHVIAAVRNDAGEMGLIECDLGKGENKLLIPFSTSIIGTPSVNGDTIAFSASSGDREWIFLLHGGRLLQVKSESLTSLGLYQPSVQGNTIVASAATAVGRQLIVIPRPAFQTIEPTAFVELTSNGPYDFDFLNGGVKLKPLTAILPEEKNYRKSWNLLNFHSLRPYVSDPDYSLSLVSENVLNNFRTELSFLYNQNEGYKQLGFFATWAGWFPWIRGGIDYTIDRRQPYRSSVLYWNEVQPRIGVSIPLDLSRGYYFRSLQTSFDYVYNAQTIKGYWKDSIHSTNFGYINPVISWVSRSQQARQQIFPRFAQSLLLNYRRAVHGLSMEQLLTNGLFYFPGLFPNNHLVLQGAFQVRDRGLGLFSNSFPFSRGYSSYNFKEMKRIGINYHFPLWYPDLGIAQVVYFLRVRANPFFDYTTVSNDSGNRGEFRSTGVEIFFDTKWWNQQAVSFGIRYSRLLDADISGRAPSQWEIILPVNLLRR